MESASPLVSPSVESVSLAVVAKEEQAGAPTSCSGAPALTQLDLAKKRKRKRRSQLVR